MAGAGYKLFNTGDVLTAAQVNTYLNEQTVMVFASSAARTTALSGVLAEGMISYLKDTNFVEYYDGTSWIALASGDLTAITAGTGITVTNGTGPVPTVAIDATVATLTGTQTLTNKTLTSPKFASAGEIDDANGAELIKFPATVASAVNEITISNAATTLKPTISATGDDTNITLNLVSKGTGTIQANGVDVVSTTNTQTLTNKTIALGSNTVSGTTAQFNTALTDGDFATIAGTETLTNKTLTSPIVNLALNAQTGTTYTFVLADNGKLVTASNAAAQTYSIPTNASVAYAIGAQINIIQIGAGQVTINAVTPGTTTISSTGATSSAPKLRAQFSSATCIKVATDTWYVVGDIA